MKNYKNDKNKYKQMTGTNDRIKKRQNPMTKKQQSKRQNEYVHILQWSPVCGRKCLLNIHSDIPYGILSDMCSGACPASGAWPMPRVSWISQGDSTDPPAAPWPAKASFASHDPPASRQHGAHPPQQKRADLHIGVNIKHIYITHIYIFAKKTWQTYHNICVHVWYIYI